MNYIISLLIGYLLGSFPMLSITAAVFSHCYSPWLKLKGGKGLATATGGSFGLSIPVFVIWILISP
ncbi:MAG: glycerol-3-phosphate acyltransferase [Bacteroidota bacterium]